MILQQQFTHFFQSNSFAINGFVANGFAANGFDVQQVLNDAGWIGFFIIALSVAMVTLLIEHCLSFRRQVFMPPGLAEEIHERLQHGKITDAQKICLSQPSFLGRLLSAGLREVEHDYSTADYPAIEKAVEDASAEQSARMFRKIEFLSLIGTIAPMLGLLGTVWGLMLAFQEFELKVNPQISELAPGIRKAMVTTLMGLSVAVPALAGFAIFRNRIDELVAEGTLTADQVMRTFKRSFAQNRNAEIGEENTTKAAEKTEVAA